MVARFRIVTAMSVRITVFWDVTSFGFVGT